MSLRIDDFKTALSGGGARANLFRARVYFPNTDIGGGANAQIGGDLLQSFMIKSAQLPGRQINPIEIPFRGRQLKVSGDTVFEDMTLTVTNDNNFAVRDAFERWQDAINGAVTNESGRGVDASTFDSYTAQVAIEQLGRNGEVVKGYTLYHAWPTSVDPIDVSFESTDTIEEFGVTLSYQWWVARTTETQN